jgi:hypothetical protein
MAILASGCILRQQCKPLFAGRTGAIKQRKLKADAVKGIGVQLLHLGI